MQWLYTHKPVKTFEIKGNWLDIGSKETLDKADAILASQNVSNNDEARMTIDERMTKPE